ncbi:MAG: aromatic ring-hydroxylating dioxygenase subunit alpha, partial [Micrococcales bacterium]|nr:aromatic ring-hydroxylating dioxygenase subunit alpha [Micrococcales bacterium]
MNYDPRSWTVHKGSDHPFDQPAPAIDNGTARPDPARYTSPEFFARELDEVFARTWLLAAPSSDIPEPGDWVKFDTGPESFIVVRQADGSVAAHY